MTTTAEPDAAEPTDGEETAEAFLRKLITRHAGVLDFLDLAIVGSSDGKVDAAEVREILDPGGNPRPLAARRLHVVVDADNPSRTRVRVGEFDITSATTSVALVANAHGMLIARVELLVHDVEVEGQAGIGIDSHTAAALTALGWTPPAQP